jgi:hypothetical protein
VLIIVLMTVKGFTESPQTHFAHAGFLNAAKSILPDLTKEIMDQVIKDQTISHITFTGHSAGGAVSSLLFLHFVSSTPLERTVPKSRHYKDLVC